MLTQIIYRLSLTILLFFYFIQNSRAQTSFQKFYSVPGGEQIQQPGYDVKYINQTVDDNYIFSGSKMNSLETSIIFIVKINTDGDTIWTYELGNFVGARSIQQTSDSGFIFTSFLPNPPSGDNQVYLIKTNENLDTLWTKTVGSGDPFGGSYSIGTFTQEIKDGKYLTVGYTSTYGAGFNDIYLIKSDAAGNTLWAKTYGGSGPDNGIAVLQSSDNNYVICGTTVSYGAGSGDIIIIKTDSAGNQMWSKTYGGANADAPYSMQETYDKGFIITGITQSYGAGGDDIFLLKTDSAGNISWAKTFGDTLSDAGSSVQQTTDNGYIITGYVHDIVTGLRKIILIKTDMNGDTNWTKAYYGDIIYNRGDVVQQTADGGYIIGATAMTIKYFGYDYALPFIVKTDSNGNAACQQNNPGLIINSPSLIVSAVSVQQSTGGITIKGSPYYRGNSGLADSNVCFVFNCNLSLLSGTQPDSSGQGVGVAWVNVSGGTPPYSYQWNDPGPQTTDSASGLTAGTYAVVVTDSNGCTDSSSVTVNNITGISENTYENNIKVYPNVNTGEFIIEIGVPQKENFEIKIFNTLGQEIFIDELIQFKGFYEKKYIDMSKYPVGIYNIQLKTSNGIITKRVIIE